MNATNPPVTRAALAADLRERAFGTPAGVPARRRLGAEVEFLLVSTETGRPYLVDGDGAGSSLRFLQRYGARRGWVEEIAPTGAPRFRLPDGGTASFEPGGQIEYSAPACVSATGLLEALRSVLTPLRAAAQAEGIECLSVGIDPWNPIECVPLQVRSERYVRMAEYFETLGPAGAKMMRQTAAFHLNLDFEDEPIARWRVLNAAAPYVIAIFANSPFYADAPTGHRSFRAHVWRETDERRTGILAGEGDGAGEYLEFCLRAPAILKGSDGPSYRPFGEWVARGEATLADWRSHLMTIYPEVRPRGYLEVRAPDAIDPGWHPAPIALLSGILYDRPSLQGAADLLGPPEPERLSPAGEAGLRDPRIAAVARDLFEIGLAGCAALGPEFIAPRELEVAREFYERYTRRTDSPADDLRDPVACRTPASPPRL